MTTPNEDRADDDSPDGAAVTGSLAAATEHGGDGGDPLAPLNAVTEAGQDDTDA